MLPIRAVEIIRNLLASDAGNVTVQGRNGQIREPLFLKSEEREALFRACEFLDAPPRVPPTSHRQGG